MFPCPFSVHIVYEHPLTYNKLILNKEMLKSLYRKKIHSYFWSEPGFEPMDLQNNTLMQTCALAHAAMRLCIKFDDYAWFYIVYSLCYKTLQGWGKKGHVVTAISLTCRCSTIHELQHIFAEQRGNEVLDEIRRHFLKIY